jgi:hypothetical protein
MNGIQRWTFYTRTHTSNVCFSVLNLSEQSRGAVIFEVLRAGRVKTIVSWEMMPCRLIFTNISEKCDASSPLRAVRCKMRETWPCASSESKQVGSQMLSRSRIRNTPNCVNINVEGKIIWLNEYKWWLKIWVTLVYWNCTEIWNSCFFS